SVIASASAEVAAIDVIVRAKKTADTVERARKAFEVAKALGYAPLEANAQFQLGEAQINAQAYAPAAASLEAAALTADRAGHDRMRARAWVELTYVHAWGLRHGQDALHTRDLASAALARVSDPGKLPIALHQYAGAAYDALGKADEALKEYDAALALVT